MFSKFLTDPFFMLKYHVAQLAVFATACALLWHPTSWLWLACMLTFAIPSFWFLVASETCLLAVYFSTAPFHPWMLLLPFLGIAGALSVTPLMHNAAHGNLSPKWLNRIAGEYCGVVQLTSFPIWLVTHLIHHGHPDDPALDPHPSGGMSFLKFLHRMIFSMGEVTLAKYFDLWGKTPRTKPIAAVVAAFLILTRCACGLMVFLLLWPTWFTFFYIPLNIANIFIYADFNYRTHILRDGHMEIVNLNEGALDKFLNAISFGAYFHKNHHRNPSVLDPRRVETDSAPMVTYSLGR